MSKLLVLFKKSSIFNQSLKLPNKSKSLLQGHSVFIWLLTVFVFSTSAISQNLGPTLPVLIPYAPTNVNLGDYHTNMFTVKAKLSGSLSWTDLFEYKTYTSSDVSTSLHLNTPAAFVNFDFDGAPVEVEVTCNYCANENNAIQDVLIRPKSRGISYAPDLNNPYRFTFIMNEPENLSVEIDGDRYRALHVFTNTPDPGCPPGLTCTTVDDMTMTPPADSNGNAKVYNASPGEVIHIEGNKVFEGMILIDNQDNTANDSDAIMDVTVLGRGVISHLPFTKNYIKDAPGTFRGRNGIKVRTAKKVTIDGIIVNDPQSKCINIVEGYDITIKNTKVISRVKYGAGIYLEATSNVTIDNCFLRTSEDCIPIYPERHNQNNNVDTDGNAENISVTNTSLYADVARPINIGVHGSIDITDKALVNEIKFDSIDILEHDEQNPNFLGAISIQCGDYNNCQNMSFTNFNIEELSEGALFTVKVEEADNYDAQSDGYRVENIIFENITADTIATESDSKIFGLDAGNCRYVNGVHFKNLVIDGVTITNPTTQFSNLYIDNNTAFDITFNKTESLANLNGTFTIENVLNNQYLNPTTESFEQNADQNHVATKPWSSQWTITSLGNGLHTIESNFNNDFLTGKNNSVFSSGQCHGANVVTQPADSSDSQQVWKIVDIGNGEYRLINQWWGHSTLTMSSLSTPAGLNTKYVLSAPISGTFGLLNRQKWNIESPPGPLLSNDIDPLSKLYPYPNIADSYFEVDFTDFKANTCDITLFDMFGREVYSSKNNDGIHAVNTVNFKEGIYFLSISKDGENVIKQLGIKH